jgi:hypothetical protein
MTDQSRLKPGTVLCVGQTACERFNELRSVSPISGQVEVFVVVDRSEAEGMVEIDTEKVGRITGDMRVCTYLSIYLTGNAAGHNVTVRIAGVGIGELNQAILVGVQEFYLVRDRDNRKQKNAEHQQ